MVFAEDRALAFAPLRLLRLDPPCGPTTGGTRLTVMGDALFAASGQTKVSISVIVSTLATLSVSVSVSLSHSLTHSLAASLSLFL